MKLLFCPHCEDIISLTVGEWRKCRCSKVTGKYLDHVKAVFTGPAVPIGIDNHYFSSAIEAYPNIPDINSMSIRAFLIPKKTPELVKLKKCEVEKSS